MENYDSKRGLVLFGLAGTGKSSLVHEIAERFKKPVRRLGSYFIFRRAERSKSKDYFLFTTAELPSNFRILITSRLNPHIEHSFINAPEAFEIKYMDDPELTAGTADDIRLYYEKKTP